MQRLLKFFWLLLGVAVIGCGSTGEGMLSVDGTVQFSDGTPVTSESATIVFHPDRSSSNKPAKSASGEIDADGYFLLMTEKPGDGAYPGDYKVVLKVWSNYRQQKSAIPLAYSEQATTPLTATVGPGKTSFDFSVDR